MNDNFLRLTAGQQNVLAQFCQLASKMMNDFDTGEETYIDEIAGGKMRDIVIDARTAGFTTQSFDRLYDLLHRSGANL